jgi:adenosylmethionine-8-amino-7-oxononanoate aminotransferase
MDNSELRKSLTKQIIETTKNFGDDTPNELEEALYTESQVRTAYKAGVLRGLEYKSRGKKKTVYETPSEEQLIQTLKKKL